MKSHRKLSLLILMSLLQDQGEIQGNYNYNSNVVSIYVESDQCM